MFPTSKLPPSQNPNTFEVPNPDAEVLLEIWSSDVTGDELMSSVPGIYKIGVVVVSKLVGGNSNIFYVHPGSLGK